MKTLVRVAMMLSLLAFGGLILMIWTLPVLGRNAEFWSTVNADGLANPVPTWVIALGFVTAFNAIVALALCYHAVAKVLSVPAEKVFATLSVILKQLSNRLVYFWISYGIASGIMPELAKSTQFGDFADGSLSTWNPFGINSVFLVLGLAFRPIAAAMKEAQSLSEEHSQIV